MEPESILLTDGLTALALLGFALGLLRKNLQRRHVGEFWAAGMLSFSCAAMASAMWAAGWTAGPFVILGDIVPLAVLFGSNLILRGALQATELPGNGEDRVVANLVVTVKFAGFAALWKFSGESLAVLMDGGITLIALLFLGTLWFKRGRTAAGRMLAGTAVLTIIVILLVELWPDVIVLRFLGLPLAHALSVAGRVACDR